MSVRLVLDASVVRAYLANDDLTGLDVAELIFTVRENGDLVGVPALTVVALYPQLGDDERRKLVELASAVDGPTVILPLLVGEVLSVAEMAGEFLLDRAHAVAEARKRSAPLASFEAGPLKGLLPPSLLLDMEDPA